LQLDELGRGIYKEVVEEKKVDFPPTACSPVLYSQHQLL
jgi:hypothetical protein